MLLLRAERIVTAKKHGGLGGGVGEVFASFDLSKATCEF